MFVALGSPLSTQVRLPGSLQNLSHNSSCGKDPPKLEFYGIMNPKESPFSSFFLIQNHHFPIVVPYKSMFPCSFPMVFPWFFHSFHHFPTLLTHSRSKNLVRPAAGVDVEGSDLELLPGFSWENHGNMKNMMGN